MLDPCKECGYGQIEWVDIYCQACWEDLCAREWWQMVEAIGLEEAISDEYREWEVRSDGPTF